MCGRFTLTANLRAIAKQFGLSAVPDLQQRFNIAPSQQVAVIRLDPETGTRQLSMCRWGLVPSWAENPSIGYKMINARAESVAIKPAYRSAFKRGRCLIVADGFYEWKKLDAKKKQPFYIRLKDGEPFAFAGLCEHWQQGKKTIDSAAIITTGPNELMEGIHDRMPVILSPDDYDLWLETEFHGQGKLLEMLKPYDAEEMEAYPVSTVVNNPRYDKQDCIEAVH